MTSSPVPDPDQDPGPRDVPYLLTNEVEWTAKAFELAEAGDLLGEVEVVPERVTVTRVWGQCPRCRHRIDDRQTQTAVMNVAGAVTRGPFFGRRRGRLARRGRAAVYPVDVTCACSVPHDGRPDGASGCGAVFRIEVPLQPAARR